MSYLINPSFSWAWDSQAAGATRSTEHLVIKFPAATTSWVLQARRFQDKVFSPLQILDNYAGMATWYISDAAW